MSTGIYQIVNTINGKRYIGSSVNIGKRWKRHISQLELGTHHSVPLQRAWLKYGASAFHFGVIVICDKSELVSTEQIWLDSASPAYNVCPNAYSRLGSKWTDESRAKKSAAMKGKKVCSDETYARVGEQRKGKKLPHLSDEVKTKMSVSKMGKSPSGSKGYCWIESRQKYRVTIMRNGKRINLGSFSSEQEAAAAYLAAQ